MSGIYRILLLFFIWVQVITASQSFIVIDGGENKENIIEKKKRFDENIGKEKTILGLMERSKIKVEIKQVDRSYLLNVGPFESNDVLALVFFKVRKTFPNAFILEEKEQSLKSEPTFKSTEKKIQIQRNVDDRDPEYLLWMAIFSLALVGIVFMFISSEQMKRMKLQHERIKLKHENLELKQSEALSRMSENIQIIAKETMNHTHKLAEKVKETPLYEDVVKVIHNENELLDVTGDLVRFLRLKSKKVVIQHVVFNFNHVLNEVAGLLNTKYKQNDIELVFDIDKDVPKYMISDSVHLAQILINLLEYFIQNSHNKEVKIQVMTGQENEKGLTLKFNIDADVNIEDKETLFDSYYDEEKRRYVGLGLFVARELISLMGGEIEIKDRTYKSSMLIFRLPIEEKNKEKRKYRLPNKDLVGKKMLIVDRSESSVFATKKLFAYFRANIDILSVKTFIEQLPDFRGYEIVALRNTLFNNKVLDVLEKLKKEQDIKVISLENLSSSHKIPSNKVIDIRLIKPLTQEYVFDTLVTLYGRKKDHDSSTHGYGRGSIQVYSEAFKGARNITLESFHTLGDAHVLIVEDDIVNQNIFLEVLGKSKIKVSVVNNGQEAIDFLYNVEEKIDILIMDINIPVMDGYMATKIIRKDSRFDHIAIIFLSALVSEHEIEKMLESGMNGYLSKPVQMEQLYTALKAFLNNENSPLSTLHARQAKTKFFEGLNVEEGIENLHGNIAFYKQVLQEFIDAYAPSGLIFENLVREQRYGQIKVLCLDMKGLTGTIGAKEMHTVINEIHQYIIYKKPELLHSYVKIYQTELEKLTRSIHLYLSL